MSPASYLTAPPRVAARSIATRETSKKLKAGVAGGSYVGRNQRQGGRDGDQGEVVFARAREPRSTGRGARRQRECAGGTFVEHDVRVLQQFDSNGPAPAGSYFGWAVSEL